MCNLQTPHLHSLKHILSEKGTISLIGMTRTGKATIGKLLAATLGWAYANTNQLIEAYFGAFLKDIVNAVGLSVFLSIEEQLVFNLVATRCVLSTSSSITYSSKAVAWLKRLGPVICLISSTETIHRRIAESCYVPGAMPLNIPTDLDAALYTCAADANHIYNKRSMSVISDQTEGKVNRESQHRYLQTADFILATDTLSIHGCIKAIHQWLATAQ